MLFTNTLQHVFFRCDSLTKIIQKKIIRVSEKATTPDDLLKSCNEAAASRNWVELSATSYVMSCLFPKKKQGYLFLLDSLLKLNLLEDFSSILKHVPTNVVGDLNLSRRLVQFYWQTKQYPTCIKECSRYKDEKFHALKGFECSIISHDIKQAETFLSTGLIPGKESYYLEKEKQWQAYEEVYADCLSEDSFLDKLKSCLLEESYQVAMFGFWLGNRKGYSSLKFLASASTPIASEHPFSDRLCFFKRSAYEHYASTSQEMLDKHIDLCFHKEWMDEAFQILLSLYLARTISIEQTYKLEMARRVIRPEDRPFLIYSTDNLQSLSDERTSLENILIWRRSPSSLNYNLRHSPVSEASRELTQQLKNLQCIIKKKSNTAKIAVCISGQLRGFKSNINSIWQQFVTPYDSDVFIHTWDKQVYAPSEIKFLSRVFGKEIANLLPDDLKPAKRFTAAFPKTSNIISEEHSFPTIEEDLINLPGVKEVAIDSSSEFEESISKLEKIWFAGKPNQAKMYYKIYECDKLRKKYEEKLGFIYDIVIRIRPDLNIKIHCIEDFFLEAQLNPSLVFTSYMHHEGVGDQLAIGSSSSMSAYSSVWHFLKKYHRFDYLEGFSGKPAEVLLGEHLMAAGVNFQLIHSQHKELASELPIDHLDIRASLIEDINRLKRPDTVEFCNAIVKHYERCHQRGQ